MTYHMQQGVNTCIARIFNTYGPRMRRNDGRASVNFLNQALEGKPLTVYGDGSQTRSLCYADDLIRGLYLLAIERRAPAREPWQPRSRADDARARADGDPRHRIAERDRVRGTPDRRSAGAPAGHHACEAGARLDARDRSRGRSPPLARRDRAGTGPSLMRVRLGVLAAVVFAVAGTAATAQPATPRDTSASGSTTRRRRSTAPSRDLFAAEDAERPGDPREPVLGRPVRRGEKRPVNAKNPNDPAYDWALYDRTVQYAQQYGIRVLFSIYATPSWESGRVSKNIAPQNATDLRNFAYAAATRYSGTFMGADGQVLPAVKDWAAWNEPNNPIVPRAAVQADGGRVDDPERDRLRADLQRRLQRRARSSIAGERVACGETAPRGNNNPPQLPPVGLADRVSPRGQEGGPQDLRRLGAPPVLRRAEPISRLRSPSARAAARRPR